MEGSSWRPHFTDRHTLKSVYGISKQSSTHAEEAANRFLERHSRLFGIDSLPDLRLDHKENSDLGSHFFYQQFFGNLPVEGAVVSVHVNRWNQVIAANSSFQPALNPSLGLIRSKQEAHLSAARFAFLEGRPIGSKLVILPLAGEAKPAWKVQLESSKFNQGSWLLYVDAQRPNIVLRALKTHVMATGQGRVYEENPVVTPDRTSQQFLYLNGKKLNGRFLKTFNGNAQYDVNEFRFSDFTTAANPDLKFNFRETDLRLPEAMAYFHINRVHDQWKKFGMKVLDSKAPVFVNVTEEDHGNGLDNAFYSRTPQFPNTGVYVFGAGHVLENLGLDADVYYHEYGHGVLDQIRPQLLEAFESNYPRAFHEAFGDVSAVAITGNSKIGEFGLRLRETKEFVGRDLENNNRFPRDVIHPQLKRSEIHHAGLIVGGAWWNLQKTIGSESAQELLFKALPLLPKEMTFFDLRDSILTTDSVLKQGLHQQPIQDSFERHGVSSRDPGQTGRMNVTSLITALFEINSGEITLKNKFQSGDIVAVLAEYRADDVTPAYNMVPESIEFQGPPSSQFLVVMLADEVVKGRHRGRNGALQLLILTDTVSKGTFKITMRSRLGGTSRLGKKRTVSFLLE